MGSLRLFARAPGVRPKKLSYPWTEDGRGDHHDNSGSVDRCGRSILGGIDRPRLRLDADAGVSLVVSKLQEGCLNQPVSSCPMPLRRDQAGGQFLQELRQLEHIADAVPALCCLLVEGP